MQHRLADYRLLGRRPLLPHRILPPLPKSNLQLTRPAQRRTRVPYIALERRSGNVESFQLFVGRRRTTSSPPTSSARMVVKPAAHQLLLQLPPVRTAPPSTF